VQIYFGRECKPIKADDDPLNEPPPPRSYRHGDSCNDDSVAADKSNVYSQRKSINANDDAAEGTDDADNSRRYGDDAAKAKAEADKEVRGGDAEVFGLISSRRRTDHAKCALKRATKWYAKEKNKTGGLSSLQIEAKVKKEFDGVGPHAATIRLG